MNAGIDLEHRLSDWLTDGAPTNAPEILLVSSMGLVDRTTQVRPMTGRLRVGWTALSGRHRMLLVAAILAALVGTALVAGAVLLQKPPVAAAPRLLVVRQVGGTAEAGVSVVAIASDGAEEILATFDHEQLGGPWTGQTITYSGDGRLSIPTYVGAADNQFAVVDLRDPAATPRFPDAVGSVATWRPDGRLAYDANDGTIAIYDPGTGVTSRLAISGSDGPNGALDPVDVGLGPRRDRDDGTRIGEPLDIESSRPDERMTDYAAARDGGRWILFETRASGPGTVRLLHVAADGTERDLVAFHIDAADAPVYSQDGWFAAMAPDDSRLVVGTNDRGSAGPLYLVDPATGRIVKAVEGQIVGWLGPDDLTKSRGVDRPIVGTPAAARGEWVRILDPDQGAVKAGSHRVQVGHTTAVLDAGTDHPVTLSVTADGADRLRFTQLESGLGCDAAIPATYRWVRTDAGLTLTAESDPCEDRRVLLEGQLEPNLPYRGNWEPRVPAGERFLVPELGLRLRIPRTGEAFVWDHNDTALSLAQGDANLWAIMRVDGREPTDCGEMVIPAGLDGVLGYLETLQVAGVTLVDRTPVTMAGLPGVRGTLRLPSDTSGICGRWPTNAGGWSVHDGETITLLEAPGGRVYSLLSRGDPAWAADLDSSLEFVPAAGS